jgi:chromosome segregation ATPase
MLSNEKIKLVDDLRQAVLNGDAGAVAALQAELARIKPISVGNRAAELKAGIEKAEARLVELQAEIQILEEERGVRNKRLAKILIEHEQALAAVRRCDTALFACDGEAENLRDLKRQCTNELAELSDSLTKTFIEGE